MKMVAINRHSSKLKIWSIEMPTAPYLNRYAQLKKEPAAQTEHLVLADTKATAKKNKRAVFCQR